MTGPGGSPAEQWAIDVVQAGGSVTDAWATLSVVERAAVSYAWETWWSRPSQLAPSDDEWTSWGLCTGRGFGKTRAVAQYVHREAMAGRAMRIALMAQNEAKTLEVMIEGDSGLVDVAPFWERPVWERGRLVWPNGAQAFVFTPEAPRDIRGPGFHLAWASEQVAWAPNRRDEAWSNLRLTTRLGYARIVWDTTPKRKHPIVRELLERARDKPQLHRIVRGATRANVANLSYEAVQEWEDAWSGTSKGREELLGEFIDDSQGVLWRAEWIEDNRAELPPRLERRVIAVDPAISMRRGTDRTGLVEAGIDASGHLYVIEDLSGRLSWEVWGAMVVERYQRHALSCVVVERNRGGDAVVANLRACARDRGLRVEIRNDGDVTHHDDRVIWVKEVLARSAKESRAEPVASLYQRGRVSHVRGAELTDLEEQLTTWEPTPGVQSPDNLDACVWAIWELAGLSRDKRDYSRDVIASAHLGKMLREIAGGPRVASPLSLPRLAPRSATRL